MLWKTKILSDFHFLVIYLPGAVDGLWFMVYDSKCWQPRLGEITMKFSQMSVLEYVVQYMLLLHLSLTNTFFNGLKRL